MALQMFQKNKSGLADRGDKIRGLIAVALCIGSFTAANYSFHDQQQLVFFMITGLMNMLVALGIVFKEN